MSSGPHGPIFFYNKDQKLLRIILPPNNLSYIKYSFQLTIDSFARIAVKHLKRATPSWGILKHTTVIGYAISAVLQPSRTIKDYHISKKNMVVSIWHFARLYTFLCTYIIGSFGIYADEPM